MASTHGRVCPHNGAMAATSLLELFPETAKVADGELVLGGVRSSELVREHGSPLVVYDEQTLRAQARAYVAAARSSSRAPPRSTASG